MVGTEYCRSPLRYGGRPPFGYEYHWRRATVACLAKLIHTALQLEHFRMKTEIVKSHVPLDKAQKDNYHIERCRVVTRVRGEKRDHGGLGLRRRGEGIGLRNGA